MATASQSIAPYVDWRQIITLPPARTYPAGTVIAQQGKKVTEVHFLAKGLLKVYRRDQHGTEHLLRLIATPGHALGAACAVIDARIASYATLTDAHVHVIPAKRFIKMLKNNASLSWQLHQMQCLDLLALVSGVTQNRHHNVRIRMEALLSQLVPALGFSSADKNVLLDLPLKYTEIAGFFSVTPEHLSRVVRQMADDGIIQREHNQILIPDPSQLCHDLALVESN